MKVANFRNFGRKNWHIKWHPFKLLQNFAYLDKVIAIITISSAVAMIADRTTYDV